MVSARSLALNKKFSDIKSILSEISKSLSKNLDRRLLRSVEFILLFDIVDKLSVLKLVPAKADPNEFFYAVEFGFSGSFRRVVCQFLNLFISEPFCSVTQKFNLILA